MPDTGGPRSGVEGIRDEELVGLTRSGDAFATNALLARYRPMVRSRARAYYLESGDADDLVQEGMIGLCEAIRDYRAERGVPFGCFAGLCVDRQLMSAVRAGTSRRNQPLRGYVSIGEADAWERVRDLVSADEPVQAVLDAEEAALVRRTLDRLLSRLELGILERHVWGEPRREIARVLGRDEKAVENALGRIRRKVEAHLAQSPSLAAAGPGR